MHVRGKFLAFVLDPLISYSMHTCVYNFIITSISTHFSLSNTRKAELCRKKWRLASWLSFAYLLARVTVSSSAFVLNVKRFAICLLDILSSFLPVESEILPSLNYLKTILAMITKLGNPEVGSMSEMISPYHVVTWYPKSRHLGMASPGFAILDSDFSET